MVGEEEHSDSGTVQRIMKEQVVHRARPAHQCQEPGDPGRVIRLREGMANHRRPKVYR